MPPKVKVTREDIIKTALALVQSEGASALNARRIATALGCSTQPVFSNFATMEELHGAVLAAAYDHYLGFLEREAAGGAYPQYKAFGMAYIRFAKEERELFHLMFLCDRGGKELTPTSDFEASVDIIMKANGISREAAHNVHMEMWACVHGIATMMATSFLALEWDTISQMLSDVYQGLRALYQGKGSAE